MKTRRNLASVCLALSCGALLTAANVTVGDQPGVIRMTSGQEAIQPPAVPPASGNGPAMGTGDFTPIPDLGVPLTQEHSAPMWDSAPGFQAPPQQGGPVYQESMPYSAPMDYSPYMERSAGVTEAAVLGRRPEDNPLFGPMMMFESNIDDGLGFNEAYHRANVRLPYHVIPGSSVLSADLSASVTNTGQEIYNFGAVWRNYDASRNRIFGWNAFFDMDDGQGNEQWKRLGIGMESLGKYLDFRANGYFVAGDESVLLEDRLVGDLALRGNSVFRIRNQSRDNAYGGADFEVGGPLPILGRRGINLYGGGYYLDSEYGHETVGFSARFEALITESATVNVNYTNDDTFGVNSWVSLAFTIPNYKERAILQPRRVRDRLADPVHRSTRIHSNLDVIDLPEALVNADKGRAWRLEYVDPNATSITNGGLGAGSLEDPWTTLQAAANSNSAATDIFRIIPRSDDSGENLTVAGGMQLFDCQVLASSIQDYTLFTEDNMGFVIPGTATATNLGPLVSNPSIVPGGSVIRLANENTILGLRIDGSNAAGTSFGTGITNPLPITDTNIVRNTFTNYATAVDLRDVSGNIVLDGNTVSGLSGASESGLLVTTGTGSMTNLLVRNNEVSENSIVGIGVTAAPNSTLNADNPNGFAGAGNPAGQTSGFINNRVINGADGIVITAQAGSTANVLGSGNSATGNTFNGFIAKADASTFNLSLQNNNFSSNLENGAFLHYLNGGVFRAVSEDLNGDGILDAGEDLNGNGILDEGIVSNTMSDNLLAGLCIFGQDDSEGSFDIGGPSVDLGNTFNGNTGAGVAVDLQDSATAQINALFNTIQGGGGGAPASLTVVLDFIDAAQAPVTTPFGITMNAFDVTAFGFAANQSAAVQNAALATVESYFRDIPTVSDDPRSPIPDGMALDIDFIIGDANVQPANGATEYYTISLGDSGGTAAGGVAFLSAIRDATGVGPLPGFNVGDRVGDVYTSSLTTFGPLDPGNAFQADIIPQPLSQAPEYAAAALTAGNLTFTRRALGLVTSHEIGHALSLNHVDDTGAITPTGQTPIMGTPAPPFLLPIQTLIEPAEFAYEATHLPEGPGDTQFQQFSVQQLINAVGLRVASTSGETKNGFAVSATGNSQLNNSVFNNNMISGASENGISVAVSGNAVAQSLTIQGNEITGGLGHGVNLHADGNGFIDADNTIGGAGTNTFRGTAFTQGNLIQGNALDGFRALASDGGTIHGNLINNQIINNTGNGASLLVEGAGTIDFGTPASNRIITGNTITGNGEAGLNLISTVNSTGTGLIDAVVQNNTIADNVGGGISSQLFGPNDGNSNVINLTVGGTVDQTNTLTGNSLFGIRYGVSGNATGAFQLSNSTITGTQGDGILLERRDAALLLADIDSVTVIGNTGNGLRVDAQGNDPLDPNQPMVGTANTVNWINSTFDSNGENGAFFRVHGDATLIADGTNNTVTRNTLNGIAVETSETGSFGDSTVGLPPGRRVLFDGITATGNLQDGLNVLATEGSRALVEVTSNRIPTSSGAHDALNTSGDSSYNGNGRDGVRIETQGGSSDILLTSGTGNTTFSGNGTASGGNGIRFDASGVSDATVRITRATISNNIAGATEDLALNNNGVLDPGEDINRNGVLDTGEDGGNDDLDTEDGDGVQFNVFNQSTATLVVGGINEGNTIQNNADDGIAISATGQNDVVTPVQVLTLPNSNFSADLGTINDIDISRPLISIVGNTIGGEVDGVPAGNGGDGVSMNIHGGTLDATDFLFDPANVDTSLADGSGVGLADGVNQSGPIVQFSMDRNLISQNNRRGVNLLLNGAAGERDRENGNSLFDPVRISLTNNEIASNGTEGIFYRADAEMNQSRATYLFNTGFAGDNRQFTYDPLQAEFLADNAGSVNGNTAFSPTAGDGEDGFFNLRTVQNSFLTVTGNTIQNNGVGTVTGEGLVIAVGTGAYTAADVRNNTFGGNLEQDVRTESFLSFIDTYNSVDDTGVGTFDVIYHDDSAQLDMRFTNNSGNQILLTSDGAVYRNFDQQKAFALGFVPTDATGVTSRNAAFFQIDDGNNLDNPNNTFINFNITQDIDGSFATGGFNIRNAADPLFPNIGFAPLLP